MVLLCATAVVCIITLFRTESGFAIPQKLKNNLPDSII